MAPFVWEYIPKYTVVSTDVKRIFSKKQPKGCPDPVISPDQDDTVSTPRKPPDCRDQRPA